jgi:hypothetical protein
VDGGRRKEEESFWRDGSGRMECLEGMEMAKGGRPKFTQLEEGGLKRELPTMVGINGEIGRKKQEQWAYDQDWPNSTNHTFFQKELYFLKNKEKTGL